MATSAASGPQHAPARSQHIEFAEDPDSGPEHVGLAVGPHASAGPEHVGFAVGPHAGSRPIDESTSERGRAQCVSEWRAELCHHGAGSTGLPR